MVQNNNKLIEELENIKFVINQRIGVIKFEDGFYEYLQNHKDDVKFEYSVIVYLKDESEVTARQFDVKFPVETQNIEYNETEIYNQVYAKMVEELNDNFKEIGLLRIWITPVIYNSDFKSYRNIILEYRPVM